MREFGQSLLVMLFCAVLSGCGEVATTAPEAPAFVEMTEAEKCQAAEEYMLDCGGEPIVSFQNNCTGDLAEDLLSLDCGQLDDALEAAGIVTTPAPPSFGANGEAKMFSSPDLRLFTSTCKTTVLEASELMHQIRNLLKPGVDKLTRAH